MRFRFCGDLDCPDWVLAEIVTLSRITSIKMKLLCTQVVNGMLGKSIDYDKVSKLASDAKYDSGDVKASVAALTFIFSSAAKHSVDEESLFSELQQLGLPKEHASALCRVFADRFLEIEEQLKKDSLKLTTLEGISWRVDYIMWSSLMKNVNDPSVQLCLRVKEHNLDHSTVHNFNISSQKFLVLLHELKQAYSIMEGLS